jgi:hypothetical protein
MIVASQPVQRPENARLVVDRTGRSIVARHLLNTYTQVIW